MFRTYKKKEDNLLVMTMLWVWGLFVAPAFAFPVRGSRYERYSDDSSSGQDTDINQSTDKASINWASFRYSTLGDGQLQPPFSHLHYPEPGDRQRKKCY
jgi:hypothetical protein